MGPIYQDISDKDEDERIKKIGETAMRGVRVGFMVDNWPGKADRYIAKILERFPEVEVFRREDPPEGDEERGIVAVGVRRKGTGPTGDPTATTERSDPRLSSIKPNGQQEAYLVLSEAERSKGFIRPVRDTYIHLACGGDTTMSRLIAETYARNPRFYSGTFCVKCGAHYPLIDDKGNRAFRWVGTESMVGE